MVTGCTRSNDGLDPKSRSQLCTESLMTNTCKNPSNPSTRHRPPERYLPALRRRGLTAALTDGRLRVTPPEKLTADVAAVLAEHAAEIKAELMAEASATATAPQGPALAPESPPQAVGTGTTRQDTQTSDLETPKVSRHLSESDPFDGFEAAALTSDLDDDPEEFESFDLPPPREPEVWTEETRQLIAWFRQTPPPSEPFETPGGLPVSDPRRYWQFLSEWIAEGPDCTDPGLTGNPRRLREVVTKAQDGL